MRFSISGFFHKSVVPGPLFHILETMRKRKRGEKEGTEKEEDGIFPSPIFASFQFILG